MQKLARGQPSRPTDFTHLAFGGFGLAYSILLATEEQQRKTSTLIQRESCMGRHAYRETIGSGTERKVYGTRKSKREKEVERERRERERERDRWRERVWPVPASPPWWSRDQYSLPPLPWLTPPARYGCPLPRGNPPSYYPHPRPPTSLQGEPGRNP